MFRGQQTTLAEEAALSAKGTFLLEFWEDSTRQLEASSPLARPSASERRVQRV